MNKILSTVAMTLFSVAAIFSTIYVIRDIYRVASAIKQGAENIPFDSGTAYLLMLCIFWIFMLIQVFYRFNTTGFVIRHATGIVIFGFVLILAVVNIINYSTTTRLQESGYTQCMDESDANRVSRGVSSLYSKMGCR